jgi:hypothetical protein
MDFLHYALIQTIKGDKEGRGRSTYFVEEIFFFCEGYWLPSVTTTEAFRSMPDKRCFFLARVLGWLRRSIAMIKSKQIYAELAGDYLGGKNVGVIGETQPNGLVRYFHNTALGTEPSCHSQVRGLANICVHG